MPPAISMIIIAAVSQSTRRVFFSAAANSPEKSWL
jgi:hypothetical protein